MYELIQNIKITKPLTRDHPSFKTAPLRFDGGVLNDGFYSISTSNTEKITQIHNKLMLNTLYCIRNNIKKVRPPDNVVIAVEQPIVTEI